ncbi:hypothetical protein KIPB_008026 [Kipferlia bialata]|uniref:Uncharacterized protein n=1 Tax=Kipferlia bialata TaxID=797122 RepID=A0A9K3D281_9EUKA|nr:hypothetical protein KIPB_008026 [Kipferlia bialata]|eukprot:g8026.t1
MRERERAGSPMGDRPGHSVFASHSPRFRPSTSASPGPGAYAVDKSNQAATRRAKPTPALGGYSFPRQPRNIDKRPEQRSPGPGRYITYQRKPTQ